MKIMSIDASTKSTGVAIFDDKGTLIYYECITASSSILIKRIRKIVKRLEELIKQYPDINKIILEEVIPDGKRNMKTYKALMWMQAAMNFVFFDTCPSVEIIYILPNSWRTICGIEMGRRPAAKQADINFVKEHYHIDVNDDIADAIAIGHSYVHQLQDRFIWE